MPADLDLLLSAERGSSVTPEARGVRDAGIAAIPRAAVKARAGESYCAAGLFQIAAGLACLARQELFAAPACWPDAPAYEAVAPLVRQRRPARVARILAVAHGPGEQCGAVILETV